MDDICKRRWGDPENRVSHMSVAWLMANVQGTIRTRSKHRVHLIQHTCIRSWASSRHYTFEACISGADRVRCGVGEVDVLGMFGSGSRGTRRLVENHGGGSCHTL